MAQKAVREYDAKRHLSKYWEKYFPTFNYNFKCVLVHSGLELQNIAQNQDWLNEEGLVVKPDMLFGKRGLNKLVYLKNKQAGDVDVTLASRWID